jgi:hypothetical protein
MGKITLIPLSGTVRAGVAVVRISPVNVTPVGVPARLIKR